MRRREGRLGRVAEHNRAPASSTSQSTSTKRRREVGAPEDQALYSCSCGYVFEAQVSTSVGCPHCGGTQAW